MDHFTVRAYGRPAPQGSKKRGQNGQLIESSPHLPAWRRAVQVACYRALQQAGVEPGQTPVYGPDVPLRVEIEFWIQPSGGIQPAGPQLDVSASGDIDKLSRAVLDAVTLGKIWKDDRQVVSLAADRLWCPAWETPGAHIHITPKGQK